MGSLKQLCLVANTFVLPYDKNLIITYSSVFQTLLTQCYSSVLYTHISLAHLALRVRAQWNHYFHQ